MLLREDHVTVAHDGGHAHDEVHEPEEHADQVVLPRRGAARAVWRFVRALDLVVESLEATRLAESLRISIRAPRRFYHNLPHLL